MERVARRLHADQPEKYPSAIWADWLRDEHVPERRREVLGEFGSTARRAMLSNCGCWARASASGPWTHWYGPGRAPAVATRSSKTTIKVVETLLTSLNSMRASAPGGGGPGIR